MKTRPPSTVSSPARQRRSVVLPHPEGPRRTTNSPSPDLEVDVVDRGRLPERLAHRLEPDVSHQPTSPPPCVEQVLADDEDHDEGRQQHEEPAGEPVRQGRLVRHREHLRGKRRLRSVRIEAANTSFQEMMKTKIAAAASPGSARGSAIRRRPRGGCTRASSPPPRARRRCRRRRST